MMKSMLPAINAETVREPPRRNINSTSRPCFFQIPLSAATHDGANPVASEGKPTRKVSAPETTDAELSQTAAKNINPNLWKCFMVDLNSCMIRKSKNMLRAI